MLGTIPDKRAIARYLRRYRYDAGLTAAEAAEAIGKRAGTLYKYESAKLAISEHDMVTLLLLYGVDLDTAFSEPLDRAPQPSRKKNVDARQLRELERIYAELPHDARAHLLEVARWALAACSQGQECRSQSAR